LSRLRSSLPDAQAKRDIGSDLMRVWMARAIQSFGDEAFRIVTIGLTCNECSICLMNTVTSELPQSSPFATTSQ
jgi:hypothetical protein